MLHSLVMLVLYQTTSSLVYITVHLDNILYILFLLQVMDLQMNGEVMPLVLSLIQMLVFLFLLLYVHIFYIYILYFHALILQNVLVSILALDVLFFLLSSSILHDISDKIYLNHLMPLFLTFSLHLIFYFLISLLFLLLVSFLFALYQYHCHLLLSLSLILSELFVVILHLDCPYLRIMIPDLYQLLSSLLYILSLYQITFSLTHYFDLLNPVFVL